MCMPRVQISPPVATTLCNAYFGHLPVYASNSTSPHKTNSVGKAVRSICSTKVTDP